MTVISWSWVYMAAYAVILVYFAFKGSRAVSSGDEYATARGGYGPVVLAVAFAATGASGATFVGLPALAYEHGISVMWFALIYPIGMYLGVAICQRMIARVGNERGNRSIPEFLGDRYQSNVLRIIAALFSMIFLFYLAGQLIAGLFMFEMMLGLSKLQALLFTSCVLGFYVILGGAHADILTDSLQGVLMLAIAILIGVLFFLGVGSAGGFDGMLATLRADDQSLLDWQPDDYQVVSNWGLFSIFVCHFPLGLLPHVANKLWALKSPADQNKFIITAFIIGMIFPIITIGGLLGRAVLGDGLLAEPGGPNAVIPSLFLELFPPFLAAALGVTVLAAIMSTADGLVISTSQIFANDIYRRTLAPAMHGSVPNEKLASIELAISRWASFIIMVAATILAWFTMDRNVSLLIWIGIGGMVSALTGPLVLGALWLGVTRLGALSGFICGAAFFIILKMGVVPEGFVAAAWLNAQAPNPFSCSTLGILGGTAVTFLVSLVTPRLPQAHLRSLMSVKDESLIE